MSNRPRRVLSFLLAAVGLSSLGLVACVGDAQSTGDEPVGDTSQDLYGLGSLGVAWPNGQVPVCFTDTSTNRALESQIPGLLAASWSAAANIHFTGFGSCSGVTGNHVSVDFAAGSRGWTSSLGQGTPAITLVSDDASSTQQHFKYEVLHEFGHALGFAHEMKRPDNWNGTVAKQCGDSPTDSDYGQYAAQPGGIYLTRDYDAASIMNYCSGWRTTLSQGDVQGAQAAYGYPNLPWAGQWVSYGMRAVSQPAVGIGPDLRLVAFGLASDGTIPFDQQAYPNSGWSSPSSIGGTSVTSYAVGRNLDGRLEVFAIENGSLWHVWQVSGSAWSGWSQLGGWGLRQVVVANEADGRLRAFALGGDTNVYPIGQTAPNGGWGSYTNIGGSPLQQIAVGRDPNGAIEVVGLASNGATMVATETSPNSGQWGGWANLAGWASKIAVGQNADGRIEIYQLGTGGSVYHQWRTPSGAWSKWWSLGAQGTDIAVSRELNGSLDVFIVGLDGGIYGNAQNGANGGWGNVWPRLGVGPFAHVAAAQNADGRIELFGVTTSGDLQHDWQVVPTGQ